LTIFLLLIVWVIVEGLFFYGRGDIKIEIQNYSHRHINAIVSMGRDGTEWKFSGIYGNPRDCEEERNVGPYASFSNFLSQALAVHGRL
jgi:hypothetical protein